MAGLALIFITERLYNDSLFQYSLTTYIPAIQDGAGSAVKSFWGIYTDVAGYGVMAAPIAYHLLWTMEISKTVYYLLVVTIMTVPINLLKLMHH